VSERTLQELSAASKTHFESREWQLAANCLIEARERFPQAPGEVLVQDSDGSIAVEKTVKDERGNDVTKREPA